MNEIIAISCCVLFSLFSLFHLHFFLLHHFSTACKCVQCFVYNAFLCSFNFLLFLTCWKFSSCYGLHGVGVLPGWSAHFCLTPNISGTLHARNVWITTAFWQCCRMRHKVLNKMELLFCSFFFSQKSTTFCLFVVCSVSLH